MTETAKTRQRKQSGKNSTRKYAKTSRGAASTHGSARRGRPAGRATTKKSTNPSRSGRKGRRTSGGLLASLGLLFRRHAESRPRGRPPADVAPMGISLDRKLDLIGIVMLFIGLLTLLSLISASHNPATASWLNFLGRAFGWGAYLFPTGLIIVGLWLILRSFQRVPRVAIERFIGVVLLFLNILAWMNFFTFQEDAYALAANSAGGGQVGAFIFTLLFVSLGWAGIAITLVAWLIIALILVLDVSVFELFGWVSTLVVRIQDGIQDWMDERRNHRKSANLANNAKQPGAPSNWPEMEAMQGNGTSSNPISNSNVNQPRPWVLPPIDQILEKGNETVYDDDVDRQRSRVIEETLRVLGAPVNVVEINRGPTITQFGVEPDFIETRGSRTRVRVAKIASLADDLALALSARTIRVEAPVPGKGYIGIEVPNEQIALVTLRDVVESDAFRRLKSPLRFALGQDVAGNAVAADLSAMPHLLIAGQTGSGKSVCVNSLICCLLLHNTPDDLRLIMVDPKRVELTNYNGIPHLLAPVVVDTEKVVGVLQWVLREMDMRYHKLAQAGARNIGEYNTRIDSQGDGKEKKLPKLVVFIDELADLMMLAPDETQGAITRLAQLSRATGIHLVIATQRPSVEVVTGIIKANFPARIAFAVASNTDSRVILDQPGAERLLGRGDMLFQAPDAPAPIRLQGTYLSDNEILSLVSYWQSFIPNRPLAPTAAGGIPDAIPAGVPLMQMPLWDDMQAKDDHDPLLEEAIDLSRRQGRASVSMLQRRLRIGYTRASRLVESMQEKGVIGRDTGPQGYEILDYGQAAPPVDEV